MSTGRNKLGSRKKDVIKSSPVKRKYKCDAGNVSKKLKRETSKIYHEDGNSATEIKDIAKKTLKCVRLQKVRQNSETVKTNEKKNTKIEECTGSGKRILQAEDVRNTKEPLCKWNDVAYLADLENLPVPIARNIIDLFNEQNTIPFIARYRGHLTGELKPEKLRKVRRTYEYIQRVHEEARKLHKQLSVGNVLTPELLSCIQTARTLEELDFIGSQFKKSGQRKLAERARQLGLQSSAKLILTGKEIINLENLVDPNLTEINDVKKVRLGIQHIIADDISKTAEVQSELGKIYSSRQIRLVCKKKKQENEVALSKYQLYEKFSQPLHTIKPHQILAINRGKSANELSVKIVIPDSLWLPLKNFCKTKWLETGIKYKLRSSLLADSVDDAIKRLLAPLVIRRLRAKLNSEAENEALSIFGYNLKQLLMTPPCSGHVVMGIDPGFKNGCKLAVVSQTGSLLHYDKFFLNDRGTAKKKLKSSISEFKCEVIALGNGTACRETEILLSKFINSGLFKPLNVSYTIISEQAVSIYSCSTLAAEEFPNLNPTVVGAISLARRLQNPLSELVKVEPKHLGVGMYQHDVSEKKLVSTLDEIVSECVSFVGVDVNSASFYLLKCTKHENCEKEFNPLDETCIHPESYETAYKIIKLLGVNLNELGSEHFVETMKCIEFTLPELAKYCGCSDLSVNFIVDALMKPKNFDLRSLSSGPILRREIKKLQNLSPGQKLEGIVRNTVPFGAFVDVGLGRDGLIHISQMGNNVLHLNNKVNVEVVSVDKTDQKIQLKLISLIESGTF